MTDAKDHRKNLRCPFIAEVEYEHTGMNLKGRISDISLGGIFIDTVNALELGEKITFTFQLPQDITRRPITGEGVVTWRQEMMGMGVEFTRMEREDWETVRVYVETNKQP